MIGTKHVVRAAVISLPVGLAPATPGRSSLRSRIEWQLTTSALLRDGTRMRASVTGPGRYARQVIDQLLAVLDATGPAGFVMGLSEVACDRDLAVRHLPGSDGAQ
jgi:hypothetical protein